MGERASFVGQKARSPRIRDREGNPSKQGDGPLTRLPAPLRRRWRGWSGTAAAAAGGSGVLEGPSESDGPRKGGWV